MKKRLLVTAALILGLGASALAGNLIGATSFVPIETGAQMGLALGYESDNGWIVLIEKESLQYDGAWEIFAAGQTPGNAFGRFGGQVNFTWLANNFPLYDGFEFYVGGGYKFGFFGIAGGINFTMTTFYPTVQFEFRIPVGRQG